VTICAAASWFTCDLVLTLEFETYIIESREALEEDGPGYVKYITVSLLGQNKIFDNSFISQSSRDIRYQTLILLASLGRWKDGWLHSCHYLTPHGSTATGCWGHLCIGTMVVVMKVDSE
jgi:hypothetical protein